MNKWLFLLLFLSSVALSENRVKVAVVDTGIDIKDPRFSDILCKEGHEDFTFSGLKDTNGHGTAIVGLIKDYAKSHKYCLIIMKYYINTVPASVNVMRSKLAFQKADKLGVKFLNYSAGGPTWDSEEKEVMRKSKILFYVAAGNEHNNLDTCSDKNDTCFYPASYKLSNIISVGAHDLSNSNYGSSVVAWESGNNIVVEAIKGQMLMSGTSMATAIKLGKDLHEVLK